MVFVALHGGCAAPSVDSALGSQVAPSSAPPTAPASPSPAQTVTLRPCTQQDVTTSFDGWGAAAGSVGGTFRVAPSSADLCGLPAYPASRFVDEVGKTILSFDSPVAQVTWVPVRSSAGRDATFVFVQWSSHGGEPTYHCATLTAPVATLEIELSSWQVALPFPRDLRPTLCADPAEQVFVQVLVR